MSDQDERLAIEWVDEFLMRAGDTTYMTLGERYEMNAKFHEISGMQSTPEQFVLQKPRPLIERYLQMLDDVSPERVLEFGIFKGGSVALLAAFARPAKYVAIELGEPVAALDEWIRRRNLGEQIKVYYGVSQDDTERVDEIIDAEFGTDPLDLVIDDASHDLPPSRVTFDHVFPRLRVGGAYAIEDWALAQLLNIYSDEKPPLTSLVMELVATWGGAPELFERIVIDRWLTVAHRGTGDLEVPFSIGAKSPASAGFVISRG